MNQFAMAGIAFLALFGAGLIFAAVGLWYMGPPE